MSNLIALALFILPVFVTVCHRMVPFFAGNVVTNYSRWRPFWVLAAFWIASLAGTGAYYLSALGVAAAGNAVLACLTGLMLWKWWPGRRAPGLLWVLILGFAWAGYTNAFVWALVMLGFSGMADNISVVIRASIMQAFTPDSMRGRVSSVNGIFIGSSNEIGAFESGLAAKLMGTVPSVVFGGVMTLLTVGLVAWRCPALWRLETLHKSPPK